MNPTSRAARRAAITLSTTALVAGVLSGCGSSSAATTTTSTAGAAARPSGSGPGGRAFDAATQQKIQQCLQAAGLPVPTFSPRPSGSPRPTRTGSPSGRPSGGGRFNDPKMRAALQACGIQLPTGRPGNGGQDNGGGPGNGGGATPTRSTSA